ncbi:MULTISPECIES: cellulose biosynthesis protein BcsQ [Acidobacterium]|nr:MULTISPECIES: cellulose biosynthesis protein BcsQ [Acidobacterium]HCT59274.1 cellulose synthase operon protein YhjQ [Acidobacterium sp.]
MDDAGDMSDPKHQGPSSKTSAADDVATLYSWANLHGAKYRDFTASRQELRMQARRRAEEAAEQPPARAANVMAAPIIDENIRVGGWQEAAQPQEIPPVVLEGKPAGIEVPVQEDARIRHAGFEETAADARHDDSGPIMPAWLEHILPGKLRRETEAPEQAEVASAGPESAEDLPLPAPAESVAAPYQDLAPRGLGERHEYPAEVRELTYEPRFAQPVAAPASPVRGGSESRWSALQDLFDAARRQEPVVSSVQRLQVPVLAIFSVAGGVGKTSLTANLGRALSSYGECPLLAETSIHGVLPFYFGARTPRPGVLRTFASNSAQEAPVQMLSLDGDRHIAEGDQSNWLYEDLRQSSREAKRIVIDVSGGMLGAIRQVLRLNPVVVVPVLPDVSSVAALQAVDDLFRNQPDGSGKRIEPRFLLNQFDASLPLHRDVRDMLLQKYGERLLPFVIHRSPAVSEALAEGLTVLDYAPASEVASDILHFAGWVRSLANAGASVPRGVRWSER